MTPMDLTEFTTLARRLATVFRVRASDEDFGALVGSYFRALQRFSLSDVAIGADVWTQRGKFFPKPAEWMESIPRREAAAVPTLSDVQAREWRRAESLRWEDAPCGCQSCVEAGVHDKPLRLVPEFTPEDRDRKVRDPIGDRIVTAGHWAHGRELAGYYRGRADFWNKYYELIAKKTMATETKKKQTFEQRIEKIFEKKRRPEPEATA